MTVLDERLKLIGKVNSDVADWLAVGDWGLDMTELNLRGHQERRRVEEAYVQGLRKLASRRPQDASQELGYGMYLSLVLPASADTSQDLPNTMAEHCQLHEFPR